MKRDDWLVVLTVLGALVGMIGWYLMYVWFP